MLTPLPLNMVVFLWVLNLCTKRRGVKVEFYFDKRSAALTSRAGPGSGSAVLLLSFSEAIAEAVRREDKEHLKTRVAMLVDREVGLFFRQTV